MISFDTETTGLDVRCGTARPFFVTTCNEQGEQRWWQWDVDPLTREVDVPEKDIKEIRQLIKDPDNVQPVVLQNAKFDITALGSIDPWLAGNWDWVLTFDTLLAGHLLASNHRHDLTSMAIEYLGLDIEPYELRLKEACTEARRMVQQARLRVKRGGDPTEDKIAEWMIAGEGVEGMPSAKGSCWKLDTWMPRRMAMELEYPEDHPWWTVLSEYANTDSSVTLALWKVLEAEIHRRGLWEIYLERLKLLPISYRMESQGVTLSKARLEKMLTEYRRESERAGKLCVSIAASYGSELTLPKSGNNKSLTSFLFGPLRLPVLRTGKKTDAPSLDKAVLEEYEATLPENSKQLTFVKALKGKRKKDTSISFMESYQKFWVPVDCDSRDLHILYPSINATGTDTLRFSYNNPNAQQISKQESECKKCNGEGCEACGGTGEDLHSVRRIFGPAPGREWWSLDYENIELRIPAYESGEKEMIELFERPDDPPYYGSNHLLNFHTVYPEVWERELKAVGFEKVGPHCKSKYKSSYYQWDKNGGFCKQYGGQRAKTDATFHRVGAFDLLESRFAGLTKLNQHLMRFAEKHGYVETIPDKMVNPNHGYPLLCTRTEYGKILPTVPLSYHVQSTAMWCTAKAMVRCQAQLDKWRRDGFDGWMILQVHDEIVFDLPAGKRHPSMQNPIDGGNLFRRPGDNLWRIRILQKLMAKSGDDIGIPLKVAATYHPDNWSEGVAI